MLADELSYRILTAFGHQPTADQLEAVRVFARFLTSRDDHAAMLLCGSAGTGKTSLAAAVVRSVAALGQKLVLLAPTGRAAKVFSLYSGHRAFTIHRRVYRQRSLEGGFSLSYNSMRHALFIVDEASMIGNADSSLLDDLVQFVYSGQGCRLMLIGDTAQLPPVGETVSPALSAAALGAYGLNVHSCTLNEVLRQSARSGILWNATRLRLASAQLSPAPGDTSRLALPRIRIEGFADVSVVPGDELVETLASSYAHAGMDDTIVVTRSNKRANIYNRGIRSTVLDREEELCRGDRLMVVRNNYFFSVGEADGFDFIANGDQCVVQRVRNVHQMHGFRFAELTLRFPDYDDRELTAMTLLDTLSSEAPALTREQQEQLFQSVMADYADIPQKHERLKRVREDRYYNALQVKFAYAVTCHKAQGGQWAHVYIDQGYMTDDMLTPDYLHWLYTAFTRATGRLYLVNWPHAQIDTTQTEGVAD